MVCRNAVLDEFIILPDSKAAAVLAAFTVEIFLTLENILAAAGSGSESFSLLCFGIFIFQRFSMP